MQKLRCNLLTQNRTPLKCKIWWTYTFLSFRNNVNWIWIFIYLSWCHFRSCLKVYVFCCCFSWYVVSKFWCSSCNAINYHGKTERHLNVRSDEHIGLSPLIITSIKFQTLCSCLVIIFAIACKFVYFVVALIRKYSINFCAVAPVLLIMAKWNAS